MNKATILYRFAVTDILQASTSFTITITSFYLNISIPMQPVRKFIDLGFFSKIGDPAIFEGNFEKSPKRYIMNTDIKVDKRGK